jgi:hypothetical protein
MSELGELLELLHGARRRYRTVRGVLRHRWNLSLSQQAHERWERSLRDAHARGTAYAMLTAVGEGPPAEPPDRQEQVVRFWSEPPARLREEAEIVAPQRYEHVTVRDGARWWTYSPEWGAMSNVDAGEEAESMSVAGSELWQPLLDPAGWIPTLDFEPASEVRLLGRRALRVRATGREPSDGDASLFPGQLPVGADAYELVVDRERGVVLRAAALLEGEEFWVCELEELVFDEELPPETFVFEPPPGEEIRGPEIAIHEPVTIEEAARRASFAVFYVPELPEGRWDLDVMYSPARERPPMEESVHLAYHRADATHHLMITERPAKASERDRVAYGPPGLETDEVERDGVSFTIYRPERRHAIPLTIALEREGTAVRLSSQNLDEDVLLALAASMRALPA